MDLRIRSLAVATLLAWGAGCATSGGRPATATSRWLADAERSGLRLEDPLATTPDVLRRVKEHIGYDGTEKSRLLRLTRFVMDADGLGFRYHPRQSLSAEQSFFARQGDCMAFSNLLVALARTMDVSARFVRITQLPVTWEDGGRFYESSHMAVAFGREAAWDQALVIDFGNPHSAPWRFALYDDVSDEEAFVLFHNNVAVEKLVAGDVDGAEQMLNFLAGNTLDSAEVQNNLALVRMQRGHYSEALAGLRAAIERFPRFRPLYANAVRVARLVGDVSAARELEARGHELLEQDPSWNFNEGMRAYQGRDFPAAAMRFEKALSSDPDNVRLLAWSARAHLAAGQVEAGLERVGRIRSHPESVVRDALLDDLRREFPQIAAPRPIAAR